MIKNYIKIAFRNLLRQKIYTAINFFGLAITLTVCIFIFLFVHDETSYDSYFQDADNIYRVISRSDNTNFGRINLPMGKLIKDYSGIISYSRLYEEHGIIKQGENEIKEKITFVDSGFVNVFSLPFLFGDNKTALKDRYSVVLSKGTSEKLFGNSNPLGKEIMIKVGMELKLFSISGVVDQLNKNSSINFSVLVPFSNFAETPMGQLTTSRYGYSNLGASLFIKLRENVSNIRIQQAINKTMASIWDSQSYKQQVILQPLKDIHLSPQIVWAIQSSSDPMYSYILTGIGFLILVLASVNFINLTLMRSSHRFKEIGLRKIIGASRKKIFFQFISEAFILSFISLIIALILTELFLPVFNQLTGKNFHSNYFYDPIILVGILLLTFLLAIISGFYPAVYMSKFNAVSVLKGNQKLSGKKSLSMIMIVFQFFVSVSLLIITIIMSMQFDYIQNKNLGYNKDNIIILENDVLNRSNFYNTLKNELLKYDNIKSVSCTNEIPGSNPKYRWDFTSEKNTVSSYMFYVDVDYLKTLKIKVKEGRDFSDEIYSDTTNSVIVNQEFVQKLNIQNPVGSIINTSIYKDKPLEIIGVAKNFNFSSLKSQIAPVLLMAKNSGFRKYIIVKLGKGGLVSAMNFIQNKWESLSQDVPFSYTFLDEYLNKIYQSEKRWNDIIRYSGIFAVLIALFGIMGLTSFSVEKRIKEIGIRKVLGANTISIIKLFIKEYTLLVLIANIIAWPVVWYYSIYWLQRFAYKTSINFTPFLLVSTAVLLIVITIICTKVYKTATTNPTKSLRYE